MSIGAEVRTMQMRENQARKIINTYTWWSAGVSLVPFPFVNIIALTGLQVRMLQLLSRTYEVPFRRDQGKQIIIALVGSSLSTALTHTVESALQVVPIVGPIIGAIAVPSFAGATTYAIGTIFMQHFESGGTCADLDSTTLWEYFRQEFARGQQLVSEMQQSPV